MGLKDKETREAAIFRPGDQKAVIQSSGGPLDTVAEVVFIEQRIRATPNYAAMTGEEKRQVTQKAKEDFANLPREEKAKLKKSPIAEETAKRLGIDTAAEPGVGEAFSIFRASPAPMGQYDFHYATVIMTTGEDRITLENAGGDQRQRDKNWKIRPTGPRANGNRSTTSGRRPSVPTHIP
jgi:hypothetical protein